jgi:hypothetical protein
MIDNACSEIACAQPSIALEELCSCGIGGGGGIDGESCEYEWSCFGGEIDQRVLCEGNQCTCFDHEEEVAVCAMDDPCGAALADMAQFAADCCGFDYPFDE